MRISTGLLFQQANTTLNSQQSSLLHLQQQMSLGKRIVTASDDPIGAAQSLDVRGAKAENEGYISNAASARDMLNHNDSVLGSATDVLQNVRTTALAAGNVATAEDRRALAIEVRARLNDLIALANSRDGNGNFLFGGFRNSAPPFTGSDTTPVTYQGDQGVQKMQVTATRQMAVTQNGFDLFESIRTGNGTFDVTPAGANTGTGVIGSTGVASPAAMTGHTYRLQFNVAGTNTTYDVVDVTTATTLSSGNAFSAGGAITVAGMTVAITGSPAAGDQFTLAPSPNQSVFTTLQKLATALEAPANSAAERASLANTINASVGNIDNALESVLSARADVGASLRELDGVTHSGEERNVLYEQNISRIEDLDYNRAISDFAQQQLALEAAQKSFVKMSGLSLFSLL